MPEVWPEICTEYLLTALPRSSMIATRRQIKWLYSMLSLGGFSLSSCPCSSLTSRELDLNIVGISNKLRRSPTDARQLDAFRPMHQEKSHYRNCGRPLHFDRSRKVHCQRTRGQIGKQIACSQSQVRGQGEVRCDASRGELR